jgi:hypothetical protein
MSDKTIVEKIKPYEFFLPAYTVVEGKGIELVNNVNPSIDGPFGYFINMVRGSKVEGENTLPKLDGVLVEQLLEVCLQHLRDVNVGELATRETDLAITAIEEAQLRLLQREINRKRANTLGTYKK